MRQTFAALSFFIASLTKSPTGQSRHAFAVRYCARNRSLSYI